MPFFRKKPVVIEAHEFTLESAPGIEGWANGSIALRWDGRVDPPAPYLAVQTLEGSMRAGLGDWIIRGVKGEFYPCKPDVFEQTYELAVAPEGGAEGGKP
jgi:hypothetical protein